MMDNVMEYKGYIGKFGYEEGDDALHGVVVNLRDVIHFQGKSIEELRQSLQEGVDDYLAWCKKDGVTPEKPFTGRFVMRISPDLHRKISTQAQQEGTSLNQWITERLEKTV
jgi:predicted HicB family RNase H-like nuclease